MWFLLGYLAGRSRPDREPDLSPWNDVERGMWVVICALAVLFALGAFAFTFIAFAQAHGLGSTLLTLFYFVVGIPALYLGLAWLGRRF